MSMEEMNEESSPDFLDSIANYEIQVSQEGFQSGLIHGRTEGLKEGFLLGLKKGSKIASDLGYYRGFANHILHIMTHSSSKNSLALCGGEKESQRVRKVCQDICNLTNEINWTDIGASKITSIETKFRQLHSLLHLEVLQLQIGSLSF